MVYFSYPTTDMPMFLNGHAKTHSVSLHLRCNLQSSVTLISLILFECNSPTFVIRYEITVNKYFKSYLGYMQR